MQISFFMVTRNWPPGNIKLSRGWDTGSAHGETQCSYVRQNKPFPVIHSPSHNSSLRRVKKGLSFVSVGAQFFDNSILIQKSKLSDFDNISYFTWKNRGLKSQWHSQ